MRRGLRLAMLATCSLVLSGCQAVSSNGPNVTQLRTIYTSPDAGGVDIVASGNYLAYNLGFGTITSYIPLNPGTYLLEADQSNTNPRVALTSTRATLQSNRQYTFLVGNVAASLQSTVLTDQSSAAPSGQISLRFIDQATKIGAIDVYAVPAGSTIAMVNPIATNITLGTNTGYINIPTGTYTLYVLPAGSVPVTTTTSATGTVTMIATPTLFSGAATPFPAGSARTIVLLDRQVVTTPAVQVIIANDYDSATATN